MNIANAGRESLREEWRDLFYIDHWENDLVIAVLEALETSNKLR